MASKTTIVERRRQLKKIAMGRKRKNAARMHGSTLPNLPLTVPNANERAQIAAKAATR